MRAHGAPIVDICERNARPSDAMRAHGAPIVD
jgi:hypothetical protein